MFFWRQIDSSKNLKFRDGETSAKNRALQRTGV